MYMSEVLTDVLEAIDVTPGDLPKIPLMKIPDPEIIFNNRNALIILSAGLLGITVYLLAVNGSSKKEKKTQSTEKEST